MHHARRWYVKRMFWYVARERLVIHDFYTGYLVVPIFKRLDTPIDSDAHTDTLISRPFPFEVECVAPLWRMRIQKATHDELYLEFGKDYLTRYRLTKRSNVCTIKITLNCPGRPALLQVYSISIYENSK